MKLASIGECMIELSRRPGGLYALAHGGDTLNTAVYLARLGAAVDYVTALGDDPYGDAMVASWQAEGVGVGRVTRMTGRVTGLYIIETDDKGERRFYYWRDRSPAREIFAMPDTPALVEALEDYDLVYLSGISLSLYGDDGRGLLFDTLSRVRQRGGRVVFDSNYRPRNWPSAGRARAVFIQALGLADIALCSADDFRGLFGGGSDGDPVYLCRAQGVGEIVVKDETEPARVVADGKEARVPIGTRQKPVDTTAAGDSFNAAYLAARLAGSSPDELARNGHRLAAAVIMHPGAIIPQDAMPAGLIRADMDKERTSP